MTSGSSEAIGYGSVIRRRWLLVVLFTCAGLVAAGAYLKVTKKTYTATASVYVTSLATDSSRALQTTTGAVNMDNEAQLARSQAVAVLAGSRLTPRTAPSRLTDRLTISVPPNTTVLDIGCQAPTARQAAACANQTARAYLTVRLGEASRAVSGSLTALQTNISTLTRQLAALRIRLSGKRASGPHSIAARLKARIDTSQLDAEVARVEALALELTSLQAPGNTLSGHVINPATPPSSPSSPKTVLILPSGIVAGLIIGLLAAFAVDARDDRLHSQTEVERLLGIPVLADVREDRAAAATAPAQALRELAEQALVAASEQSPGVLVAGASPGAGVSWTAAHLAVALSQLSAEVTVVSAADGVSLAPRLLGVPDLGGPAELDVAETSTGAVAHPVPGLPNLHVVVPEQSRCALAHRDPAHRRSLLDGLGAADGYLVIEAPLLAGASAAYAFRDLADGAIVVIERAATSAHEARHWVQRLERMRVDVLGAVLVRPARARRSLLGLGRVRRTRAADAEPVPALAAEPRAAGVPD